MKQAPKNSTTAEFQIGVVLCETKTATDTSRLPRFPERPHLRRSVAKPTREPPHPTSRGSTLNKQGSLTSKFSAGQPTPVLKLQLAPAVATLRAAPRICVLDKSPRSFSPRYITPDLLSSPRVSKQPALSEFSNSTGNCAVGIVTLTRAYNSGIARGTSLPCP